MGVILRYRDFRKQYIRCSQGVFWLASPSWYPPGSVRVNVGLCLSERLCEIAPDARSLKATSVLAELLPQGNEVVLENIEVLFTPSLQLDVPATLLTVGKNRKICAVWPGEIIGKQMRYGCEGSPEHSAADIGQYVDTYVITK